MPSPAEYETETNGTSPTAAASACAIASSHSHPHPGKLVRQNSVREEENLTPEIVIIKNGTLSRSCTEETERIGDSIQEIFTPSSNNNNEEPKLDIEETCLSARCSLSQSHYSPDINDIHDRLSHDSILSIGDCHFENVSKLEFEVFETETPGRGVSSIFICLYTALGATILSVIILTIVFDFGMLLLLVMTVIIFIIIVVLTNTCTMVYQL